MEIIMKHGYLFLSLMMGLAFIVSFCACETTETAQKGSTVNYWDKKKGDCDSVLSMPHAYTLQQITYCTKLWEMYRYVEDIPLKDRSMYAVAFSQVSHQSNDAYDRSIADAALARICIPRHPMGSDGMIHEQIPDQLSCNKITSVNVGGRVIASSNPFLRIKGTVTVQEPTAAQTKEATAAYKKAMKTRKTNPSKAIPQYQEALRADPYYVAAKYDLACAQAVTGDERGALKTLEELYSWDDSEAEARLEKARTDEDFESIRANPNFKLLTGYVSIALINGAGSMGEPQVAAIKKKLESNNYTIETVGKSNRVESTPQIWYREGFEDYAQKISRILNQKNMSVKMMTKPTSDNDVLVVWGQPSAIGAGQSAPVVQGTRAQGSDNKLEDALGAVDDAGKTVDHAKSTGGAVTSMGK